MTWSSGCCDASRDASDSALDRPALRDSQAGPSASWSRGLGGDPSSAGPCRAPQLVVHELVMADRHDRWRVDVNRHGTRLVVHAVDAVGTERERLAGAVGADAPGPAHGEGLVRRAALDHEDADARPAVIVESGVPSLPPRVQPRLAVVVAPEQLERARATAGEPARVDARGCRPCELGAFVRVKRTAGVGEVLPVRRHRARIPTASAPVCSAASGGSVVETITLDCRNADSGT